MSLALNIWKPQKDNKVRDNLRGLLGSYFHHSDHPRKFMGKFQSYHWMANVICEHQPGPIKNHEVLPWCETLRAKLHGGSIAFAGAGTQCPVTSSFFSYGNTGQ